MGALWQLRSQRLWWSTPELSEWQVTGSPTRGYDLFPTLMVPTPEA